MENDHHPHRHTIKRKPKWYLCRLVIFFGSLSLTIQCLSASPRFTQSSRALFNHIIANASTKTYNERKATRDKKNHIQPKSNHHQQQQQTVKSRLHWTIKVKQNEKSRAHKRILSKQRLCYTHQNKHNISESGVDQFFLWFATFSNPPQNKPD